MRITTVQDLIGELEQYEPDAQVRIAMQPSWPLRGFVQAVGQIEPERYVDDDEDASERAADENAIVWIAVDQSSGDESPYAPHNAWDHA